MAHTDTQKSAELDLDCPLAKDAPLRRYTRLGLKVGFWFFFLKGLAWLAVGGSALFFSIR